MQSSSHPITPDLFIHNDWTGEIMRYSGPSANLLLDPAMTTNSKFDFGIAAIQHEPYPGYSYAPVWVIPAPSSSIALVLAAGIVLFRRTRKGV